MPPGELPSSNTIRTLAPLRAVWDCPELRLHQAPDVFALWQAWEEECGRETPVPFWAVVWPAAAVLARYLLSAPDVVKGKRVLEIGCGGGAVSLAAAAAGAGRVIANDIDPLALEVALMNARANALSIDVGSMDLVTAGVPAAIDIVLVADLFYERTASRRILSKLHEARQRGTPVLIADAQRPFAPNPAGKPLTVRTAPADRELEGVAERSVRIFNLQAP